MRLTVMMTALLSTFAVPVTAATITALGDSSAVSEAPARVADPAFGNNDGVAVAFNERSNVVLDQDMVIGGTFFAAGTALDSHMIYHDRASGSGFINAPAHFEFSSMISAVIVYSQELYDTDAMFGALGSEYTADGKWYGLESRERNSIRVGEFDVFANMRVNNGFDAVRVLTVAAVPTPAAGLLLLTALGLGVAARRRG